MSLLAAWATWETRAKPAITTAAFAILFIFGFVFSCLRSLFGFLPDQNSHFWQAKHTLSESSKKPHHPRGHTVTVLRALTAKTQIIELQPVAWKCPTLATLKRGLFQESNYS